MGYEDKAIYDTDGFEYLVEFEYSYASGDKVLELDGFDIYIEGVNQPIQASGELEQEIEEYLFRVLDALLVSGDIDYYADHESGMIDQCYDSFLDR